jgi:hypothetical protein
VSANEPALGPHGVGRTMPSADEMADRNRYAWQQEAPGSCSSQPWQFRSPHEDDIVASYTFRRGERAVVVSDGNVARIFYDHSGVPEQMEFTAIERAVLVARLRALADLVEEAR